MTGTTVGEKLTCVPPSMVRTQRCLAWKSRHGMSIYMTSVTAPADWQSALYELREMAPVLGLNCTSVDFSALPWTLHPGTN